MIHVFRPKGVIQIVLFRIDNLIAVLHLNALDLIDIIPGSVTSCLCFTKNLEEKKEGRDLTQSYDKSPYTDRKIQKA